MPLTVQNLVKFAKSADPWATGIAIFWSNEETLFIWGLVDQVLHLSTSLVRESAGTYVQPGTFQAVINGAADITVLRERNFVGRMVQELLLTEQNDCLAEGPIGAIISGWMGPLWKQIIQNLTPAELQGFGEEFCKQELLAEWVRTLSRILIQIQRQRHGGAILLTPFEVVDLSVKHGMYYPRLLDGILRTIFYRVVISNIDQQQL